MSRARTTQTAVPTAEDSSPDEIISGRRVVKVKLE